MAQQRACEMKVTLIFFTVYCSIPEHDSEHGVGHDRVVLRESADVLLPAVAGGEGSGKPEEPI